MPKSRENLIVPILPTGVTQKDLSRAQAYGQWKTLDNKVSNGTADSNAIAQWKSVPNVGGRPAWVSRLSEQERNGFEKANRFLAEQQSKQK
jgi:hypothetical protein